MVRTIVAVRNVEKRKRGRIVGELRERSKLQEGSFPVSFLSSSRVGEGGRALCFFLSHFWVLFLFVFFGTFLTCSPALPYSRVECVCSYGGGLDGEGRHALCWRCNCSSCELQSTRKLPVASSPPPRWQHGRPLSHRISCFLLPVLGEPCLRQLKGTVHDFEQNSGD